MSAPKSKTKSFRISKELEKEINKVKEKQNFSDFVIDALIDKVNFRNNKELLNTSTNNQILKKVLQLEVELEALFLFEVQSLKAFYKHHEPIPVPKEFEEAAKRDIDGKIKDFYDHYSEVYKKTPFQFNKFFGRLNQ